MEVAIEFGFILFGTKESLLGAASSIYMNHLAMYHRLVISIPIAIAKHLLEAVRNFSGSANFASRRSTNSPPCSLMWNSLIPETCEVKISLEIFSLVHQDLKKSFHFLIFSVAFNERYPFQDKSSNHISPSPTSPRSWVPLPVNEPTLNCQTTWFGKISLRQRGVSERFLNYGFLYHCKHL